MSHTFQAVWPIITGPGRSTLTDKELIEDALADLPNVADRHGVKLTGKPQATITHGSQFPGIHNAEKVIIAECPAHPLTQVIGSAA